MAVLFRCSTAVAGQSPFKWNFEALQQNPVPHSAHRPPTVSHISKQSKVPTSQERLAVVVVVEVVVVGLVVVVVVVVVVVEVDVEEVVEDVIVTICCVMHTCVPLSQKLPAELFFKCSTAPSGQSPFPSIHTELQQKPVPQKEHEPPFSSQFHQQSSLTTW